MIKHTAALLTAALLGLGLPALAAGGAEETLTLELNGDVHTFTLSDLKDGEVRTLSSGDHTFTVTRQGERLHVAKDGEALGGDAELNALLEAEGVETTGGEARQIQKAVFINTDGDATDVDIEALGEDFTWVQDGAAEGEAHKVVVIKEKEVSGENGDLAIEKDVKVIVIKKQESGE